MLIVSYGMFSDAVLGRASKKQQQQEEEEEMGLGLGLEGEEGDHEILQAGARSSNCMLSSMKFDLHAVSSPKASLGMHVHAAVASAHFLL